MTKNQKIDLLLVIGMVLLSIPIIVWLNVRPLVSTVFFFIIPSIYLLIRKPRNLRRIFTGAFLIGMVFGFVFDFLAILNNAWSEPVEQLVFKYKVLNIVPIDHIIWFFFWALIIIVFYEHFLEHERADGISHNFKYGLIPGITATIAILALFFIAPETIRFGYSYLILGGLTFLPFLFLMIRRPILFIKFVKVTPFFFLLFLAFELTAIYLEQWYFPGLYIGYVEVLGLRFPFEEFFFWILMSSTIVLSYYELYVDDER